MPFDPQGYFAQLHCQRVFIHPINAMGNHISHGFPYHLRGWFFLAGTNACQLFSQSPGGGQQEVSGTAGGVEHFDPQQHVFFFCFTLNSLQPLLHHRLQRGFDQLVYQSWRGIVGACTFALRAVDEIKSSKPPLFHNHRMKLQQTFIHTAQFLHIQGGVVHPAGRRGSVFPVPGQMPEGAEQVAVGNQAGVEEHLFK